MPDTTRLPGALSRSEEERWDRTTDPILLPRLGLASRFRTDGRHRYLLLASQGHLQLQRGALPGLAHGQVHQVLRREVILGSDQA